MMKRRDFLLVVGRPGRRSLRQDVGIRGRLSEQVGALARRLRAGRHHRYPGAPDRAVPFGKDRPAVRHREQGRAPATTSRSKRVLAAPADGYTVLLVNPANGINATLYKKLSFNFIRDIAPVGGLMRVPNVMVVNNDVPAKTVEEFIDYAKANPGKVNMASSGNGTSVHLSGELFMAMTGVEDDPRAVSRLESRADRHHGRPVPGAVRQHAVVDRADQSRQDPRARRSRPKSAPRISRMCRRSTKR